MSGIAVRGLSTHRAVVSALSSISSSSKHTLAAENVNTVSPTIGEQKHHLHQSVVRSPAVVEAIKLPANIEEVKASEKVQFSRKRSRDTSSARISANHNQVSQLFGGGFMGSQGSRQSYNSASTPNDNHVGVYEASNTVSLSSVMQTNVPHPYQTPSKAPVHLNMPGGQWSQDDKYLSGELHDHHTMKIVPKKSKGINVAIFPHKSNLLFAMNPQLWCASSSSNSLTQLIHLRPYSLTQLIHLRPYSLVSCKCVCLKRCNDKLHDYCTHKLIGDVGFGQRNLNSSHFSNTKKSEKIIGQLSQKDKLKRAVKEYGATVIVFHVTISLASLGFFYLLVSSGVDMTAIIKYLNLNIGSIVDGSVATAPTEEVPVDDNDSIETVNIAAGVSTFVLAYAVHKVFAPVRIAVTLSSTPFIVRYLRNTGFLKPPKSKR